MKKLLDSSLALALASGFLFCLGRSYQEGFLDVFGLGPAQVETSVPRTLMAGSAVFYFWLLRFWPVVLPALALIVAARHAQKQKHFVHFQKFFSMFMSSLRG